MVTQTYISDKNISDKNISEKNITDRNIRDKTLWTIEPNQRTVKFIQKIALQIWTVYFTVNEGKINSNKGRIAL